MVRPQLVRAMIILGLGGSLVRCYAHAGSRDERRMCSGGPTYPITTEECERWTAPAPTPLPTGLVVRDASVDAEPDHAADASDDVSDSTVATPDAVATVRPCKRKSVVSPSAPDHIEIGCTKAEVIAAEGAPSAEEGEVWTYRFPKQCSEIRITVHVRFAKGRVVRVDRSSRRTGEFCADSF